MSFQAPGWWEDLFREQVARLCYRRVEFTLDDVLAVVGHPSDMLLLHPDSDEAVLVNKREATLMAQLVGEGAVRVTGA